MRKMSIGAAFSETFAFLKANWTQMLIWIGGAVLVVGLLGYLMLGSLFTAAAMAGSEDPSAAAGVFGRMILFALMSGVILSAVCMFIWRKGLHPDEAPNFGWALQAGPAFAFIMFVVYIAAYVVTVLISLVVFGAALAGTGSFSPEALASGAVSGGVIVGAIALYIAIVVFFLWVQSRISVAGPVMADRLTRNPVTGIGESWRLTGASQWSIVGFYVLFTILSVVYIFVAGMIFGGIMGAVAGGSVTGAIISAIVMAIVVYVPLLLVSFSMPMGIYRAIAPSTAGDVFA